MKEIVEQMMSDYLIDIDEKNSEAIIGVVERFGEDPSPLYSSEKLAKIIGIDGMEYFEGYHITSFITMDEIADAYPENLCYPEFDGNWYSIIEKVYWRPL